MNDQEERINTELSLLETMYPDQVQYIAKAREVKYKSTTGAFALRLPSGYLSQSADLPEVLSASAGNKDLREPLKQQVGTLPPGEEVLDSIISVFDDLAEGVVGKHKWRVEATARVARLLTAKPGYPGVLLYSGPAEAVHDFVNELKQQNWQAFQIRLEVTEEWLLRHGTGVIEVETMKEVVAEVGEARKDVFLEAMRMK
ncbi:hypothetical protein LTR91_012770 [Friedmanniomyces endolithicus]|uniref:RWD domain-containing protein n=1 Tax=Friedmanniomyces endolithicus TaxID=329885 RepID=A0AAN6KEN0_9PEZI|nr:hypothetical protein LTR57_022984 [Friedmanniomyces endolithicus]KAK0978930.1 hypothetical protein LTR91_012770 [Friedmanniomyces endolithicus]KAK0984677.1 hypothetical protein LTS01_010586 [Friedmanniomyces endolithicus]KAK1039415.1 hypothetical protein LTS16_011231 [Friedmanniomyces endolithicus]